MENRRLRHDRAACLRRRTSTLYAVIYVIAMGAGIGLGVVGGLLITLRR